VRAFAALLRETGRDAHEDDEDESSVRFRLRCPRRVARLWRDVVELARRMAGTILTQGQAAEAIAAEGLSARSACAEAWPGVVPPDPGHPDPDETRAAFVELDWDAVRKPSRRTSSSSGMIWRVSMPSRSTRGCGRW